MLRKVVAAIALMGAMSTYASDATAERYTARSRVASPAVARPAETKTQQAEMRCACCGELLIDGREHLRH